MPWKFPDGEFMILKKRIKILTVYIFEFHLKKEKKRRKRINQTLVSPIISVHFDFSRQFGPAVTRGNVILAQTIRYDFVPGENISLKSRLQIKCN